MPRRSKQKPSSTVFLGKTVLPKLLKMLYKSCHQDIKNLDVLNVKNNGAVFAFWHGNMITGWLLAKQCFPKIPYFAIVSLSKDGEILSGALQALGFKLIRGSSSKGKRVVKVESRDVLEKGFGLAVTPDGPRGPRANFKYGLIRLASTTSTPIYFASIQHHNKWVFKRSWDQFEVPKPFSKVDIVLHRIDVPQFDSDEALQEFTHALSEKFAT